MPRGSFLFALLCATMIVGCDGCRRDPKKVDQDDTENAAPLADFSSSSPDPFPSRGLLADGNGPAGRSLKPGHWMTASQSIKSNKDDARGELVFRASSSGAVFRTGQSDSESGIASRRPVVLPKGQQRRFDFRILSPIPVSGEQKRCTLSGRFTSSENAQYHDIVPTPFSLMGSQEYHLVILTGRPERFGKFRKGDWVKPFREKYEFQTTEANYRIVIPPIDGVLPLGETMLDWTSAAVLVWDDLPPDGLTPDQETAIADWVHFGGQLIVNGADASDSIAKTGLAGLLPLRPTGNIELDPDAGAELLSSWSVKPDPTTDKQIALLRSQSGRVAVDGVRADSAEAVVGSGNLILRRDVGRGRVIQSRFDLTSTWMVDWGSYDSFVNSVLLERPARRFVSASRDGGGMRQQYASTGNSSVDASINTRLRLASRDAVLKEAAVVSQAVDQGAEGTGEGDSDAAVSDAPAFYSYVDPLTGLGGWTDQSDWMLLGQSILQQESGIEIPPSSLVIRSMGIYLLVLVPLNFIIFRLINRLEYAWLAVPVIAIGGAIWVARQARLDIGFARSQTEIALLEMQPEYARGHLTRTTALYNSLSSTYRLDFKTVDGCATPIVTSRSDRNGDEVFETSYQEGPSLSGIAVGSNQIRMIHSEQIVDVGGPIRIDDGKLVNESEYELFDAYVLDKADDGTLRVASVGNSPSGSAVAVRYRESTSPAISDELPMRTASALERLTSSTAMPPGSSRLVARIDGAISGVTVSPSATQTTAQTIVLAHLKHPRREEFRGDINLRVDIKTLPLGPEEEEERDPDSGDSDVSDPGESELASP